MHEQEALDSHDQVRALRMLFRRDRIDFKEGPLRWSKPSRCMVCIGLFDCYSIYFHVMLHRVLHAFLNANVHVLEHFCTCSTCAYLEHFHNHIHIT